MFTNFSGLKQHSHIHCSSKPFRCNICTKSYTQFSNLCRHRKTHSIQQQTVINSIVNERIFLCQNCKQKFLTQQSLLKHKTKNCCNLAKKQMTSTVFKPFLSNSVKNKTETNSSSPLLTTTDSNGFILSPLLQKSASDFSSFFMGGSAFIPLQNGTSASNIWQQQQNLFSNNSVIGNGNFPSTNSLLNLHLNPFLAAALLARQFSNNNHSTSTIFDTKDSQQNGLKPLPFFDLTAITSNNNEFCPSQFSTFLRDDNQNENSLYNQNDDESDCCDVNGVSSGLLNSSTAATSEGASTPPTSL